MHGSLVFSTTVSNKLKAPIRFAHHHPASTFDARFANSNMLRGTSQIMGCIVTLAVNITAQFDDLHVVSIVELEIGLNDNA